MGDLKLAEYEKEKWRKLLDITLRALECWLYSYVLLKTDLERYFSAWESPHYSFHRDSAHTVELHRLIIGLSVDCSFYRCCNDWICSSEVKFKAKKLKRLL